MNLYFIPVDLRHWNLFKAVKENGHIELFTATKSMTSGDLVVIHVGQQTKTISSGIYTYGTMVTDPYMKKDASGERCNNRLAVDVCMDSISYSKPYMVSFCKPANQTATKCETMCF